MGTLANSEEPDEMQHNAAFHLGLICWLRLKQSSGKEIHHNLENSTEDPLKYTIGSPIAYQYLWENPSEYKGLIQKFHQIGINCHQELRPGEA